MDSITIGQIVKAMGTLTVIVGFFIAIFKWYKINIIDKFDKANSRLDILEEKEVEYQKVAQDSKEERYILLEGLLACLKGLHNDLNCNGPVTQGIEKVEKYLMEKSHE